MNEQQPGVGDQRTLFGHPVGLYTLFFAEMWERFSYYGMRALLLFYMLKGFLKYDDHNAYAIYGSYTALVYMTPFFGGMLADRLLGARRAVVLGGLFMAAGHLTLTVENNWAFFTALALLIIGNGFFKPNISTIVGSLYPAGSAKRDGGFTIFYMGINLGAAMGPLLCGYIGEKYGWHKGFGLATVGMLTGTAIFVAPSVLAQLSIFAVTLLSAVSVFVIPEFVELTPLQHNMVNLSSLIFLVWAGFVSFRSLARRSDAQESDLSRIIGGAILLSGAVAAAVLLFTYHAANFYSFTFNVLVGITMIVAGTIAAIGIGMGGLPDWVGEPPDENKLREPLLAGLSAEHVTYLGAVLAIPVFLFLVSGFSPFNDGVAVSLVPQTLLDSLPANALGEIAKVFLTEMSKPAGLILLLAGFGAAAYLVFETISLERVPRERMFVVLILTFFSMVFWALFEQAGSSVNNFTDRNVDRVFEHRVITAEEVGKTIIIEPTQEQLGYHNGDELFTLDRLNKLREEFRRSKGGEAEGGDGKPVSGKAKAGGDGQATEKHRAAGKDEEEKVNEAEGKLTIEWTVAEDNVGMGIAEEKEEIPASVFQSVNPIYILVFGLIFSALWGFLGTRGLEPSTPFKFSLGLLQLGLGYVAFWYGAAHCDERGMVAVGWLLLGYLLHTTGELCLSPVGLSMVTRLSPRVLVSTVMGVWFLATAYSQFLAAVIAQFTGGSESGGPKKPSTIPPPIETVHIYGGVFHKIAIAAIISSVICFALVPLLKRWMHEGVEEE